MRGYAIVPDQQEHCGINPGEDPDIGVEHVHNPTRIDENDAFRDHSLDAQRDNAKCQRYRKNWKGYTWISKRPTQDVDRVRSAPRTERAKTVGVDPRHPRGKRKEVLKGTRTSQWERGQTSSPGICSLRSSSLRTNCMCIRQGGRSEPLQVRDCDWWSSCFR